MKKVQINTNLPPNELEAIGDGLCTLAKSKREKPLAYENSAEKGLVTFATNQLAVALKSIQTEYTRVLLKE